MKCKQCGCEVMDGEKFCPVCGAEMEVKEATVEAAYAEPVKKQAKCWAVFAKVAKILGYLSFIPFVGLCTGEPGIVFAILGMRCNGEEEKKMAKTGLICSIIGLAISFVIYIIFYVVVIAAELIAEGYY